MTARVLSLRPDAADNRFSGTTQSPVPDVAAFVLKPNRLDRKIKKLLSIITLAFDLVKFMS
jgi:hypothetical protein